MRSLLLVLLAGAAAAGPGRVPATEFARRVLNRCDLVVEGRVVDVRPVLRGVTGARIEVERRLWGHDRSPVLSVLYLEDASAPDAFDPAARRGARLGEDEQGLFFLRRERGSWSLVNVVARHDALYGAKRARFDEILDLERGGAYDLRLARAREVFLRGLESESAWTRGNSARELAALARRFPSLFPEGDAERLARRLRVEPDRGVRDSMEAAVAALDARMARALAADAEREERRLAAEALAREAARLDALEDPDLRAADLARVARVHGRAATSLLAGLLRDEAAIVRERAAQGIGDFGGPSAGGALRDALAVERDEQAAAAMVYALGRLREEAAVDVLVARADDPALRRAVLESLGRMRTPAGRAALEELRPRVPAADRALVDRLLEE